MTGYRIEPFTSMLDLDAVMEVEHASFTNPWTREMYLSDLANEQVSHILLAREDGNWKVVVLKEFEGGGSSVRDLEFLIGTWSAKGENAEVRTTYEWTANKSFVRCRFSIQKDGKTQTGMQMIGEDPESEALKVWTFEDEGSVGESIMRREGKRWIMEARAAMKNGSIMTATNILTPIDGDSFSWQSVSREVDDEAVPDLAPVKVMRIKGNQ